MNGALDTLGLGLDATHAEARSAYRRLAREHHPDRGGDAKAFRVVAEAWSAVAAAHELAERTRDILARVASTALSDALDVLTLPNLDVVRDRAFELLVEEGRQDLTVAWHRFVAHVDGDTDEPRVWMVWLDEFDEPIRRRLT